MPTKLMNSDRARILLRTTLLACLYAVLLAGGLIASYLLRFDLDVPGSHRETIVVALCWIVPLKLITLALFGQFRGLLSYFSTPDLTRIVAAFGVTAATMLLARSFGATDVVPPRGVILADFVLSLAAFCALRVAFRIARERYLSNHSSPKRRFARVAIVGAGDVGAALARELLAKPWLGMKPVAFFDDVKRRSSSVHGVAVVGRPEMVLDTSLAVCKKLRIEKAIIAMPSAPAKRIRDVVNILRKAKLDVQTVPSMSQLASGQVQVTAIRPIEIEDLLRRERVEIDSENVQRSLAGRVVMVTGAGGSIGSELCRQICSFGPEELLLVERSEPHLFAIEQELLEAGCGSTLVPLIGDVVDMARMEEIFREFKPTDIFHAAAHKHVPMMERQPAEAVKNNSIATAHLATLAAHHCVERFVLISTDKAINPTSVMGASKRLAEMFIQALAADERSSTRFMAVRFGNVLGSSGSVVPTFSRQIAAGGPVKVTHPEMTRYFMTIPEATRLVLQSAAQGEGGEIFVLDMGNPVRIIDLARQMIELSGFVPGEDIKIEITGLRPGEKLFEELSHASENMAPTAHPKVMRFVTEPLPFAFVRTAIDEFVRCVGRAEPQHLKQMLQDLIPEYRPYVPETGAPAAAARSQEATRDRIQHLNPSFQRHTTAAA